MFTLIMDRTGREKVFARRSIPTAGRRLWVGLSLAAFITTAAAPALSACSTIVSNWVSVSIFSPPAMTTGTGHPWMTSLNDAMLPV